MECREIWKSQIPSSRTEDGAPRTEDGARRAPSSNSVLQDGGRSSRTESGPEPDCQTRGRSPLRPQTPSSRTEDGARGRSPVRSPIPRSQDGVHSVLKLRPPGRRTERVSTPSSVLQDGGRSW
eukprot:gene10297-biopygen6808